MKTNRRRKNSKKKPRSKPLNQMSEEELIEEAIARSMMPSSSSSSSTAISQRQQRRHAHTQSKPKSKPLSKSSSQPPPKHTPTPLDGRFVLRDGSESHALASIPNTASFFDTRSLAWEDVLEFISFEHNIEHNMTSCPICQEPPLVARVGECGHKMCLPCFLRIEQHGSLKCSICNQYLTRALLRRSTVAANLTNVKVGSVVSFQLIRQCSMSTDVLPLPASSLHNPCCLTSAERVASMIDREGLELERYLALAQQDAVELRGCGKVDMAKDELKKAVALVKWSYALLAEEAERELCGSTNSFVQAVLLACRRTMSIYSEATQQVKGMLPSRRWEMNSTAPLPVSVTPAIPTPVTAMHQQNRLWVLDDATRPLPPAAVATTPPLYPTTTRNNSNNDSRNSSSNNNNNKSTEYYYYQISTGEYCFLHPLMVKILKDMYGKYEDFPSSISVKIVQIDEEVLHANNFNKYKYLRCLPLGASVSFCEVQLGTNGIVSKTVLAKYKKDLSYRARARQQRTRRDERFSRKAAKKTEASYKTFVFENNGGCGGGVGQSSQVNPFESPEMTSQESFPFMGMGGSNSSASSGTSSESMSNKTNDKNGKATRIKGAWGSNTVSSDVKQFSLDGRANLIKSQAVLRGRGDPKWAELTLKDVTFNKDGQATVRSQTRLNLHTILSSSTQLEGRLAAQDGDGDDTNNEVQSHEDADASPFAATKSKKKKKKKKQHSKGVMLFSTSGGRSR